KQSAATRWLQFSPDSKTIATSAGDHLLHLWDLNTGHERRTIIADVTGSREASIAGMTFDGLSAATILTAHRAVVVRFCSTASGKEQRQGLTVMDGKFLENLACTRDGKVVATSLADGTIRLLDSSSGQELASLKGQSRVSTLVFSPDDKMLVSSGFDTNIRLW